MSKKTNISEETDNLEELEEVVDEGTDETEEVTVEDVAEAGEEETIEETEESEDSEEKSEKDGFFKKKKKDKKDEQIEELNDRIKRQMAEFENFRKRTEKEKTMMFDMGAKMIIEKILPVVDNFERGFETVDESDKEDAFVVGMDKVYKQFITELENVGVKPIESVGKEFDQEYHNAVMQVESDEYEEGIIAQEFQKGYTYKDSVVRHSMVAVVQ